MERSLPLDGAALVSDEPPPCKEVRVFCPVCGSKNPDAQERCGTCGGDLRASAAKLQESRGVQPVSARPGAGVPSKPKMATMLGVALPAAGSQAPPVELQAPISQAPSQPRPAPVSVGGAPPAAGKAPRMGTMLGVAMPAPGSQAPPSGFVPPSQQVAAYHAPSQQHPPQPQPQPHPPQAPGAAHPRPQVAVGGPAPAAPASARRMGTMLGVAMPAPGSVAPPQAPAPYQPAQPGWGAPGVTSQSSLRSDDRPQLSVRMALARALQTHGPGLIEDGVQLEQLLMTDYQRNLQLVLTAQRAGVPDALRVAANGEGVASASVRLVAQLERFGMKQDDARYAVDSWAVALGL